MGYEEDVEKIKSLVEDIKDQKLSENHPARDMDVEEEIESGNVKMFDDTSKEIGEKDRLTFGEMNQIEREIIEGEEDEGLL